MGVNVNPNILSLRYASSEMNYIFSRENQAREEREWWLNVLKEQRELGMDVPEDAIEAYETVKNIIYFERIKEIELETKHDVMAKVMAYNEVASEISGKKYQELHQGMTSKDLTDNVDQIMIIDASKLVFGKYVSILNKFSQKAKEYDNIITTGRTHNQIAMATL
ncbi:MAG: adenylosuccinate lyase, partial [archaeon]